jgi:hypothetical protein
MAAGQGFKTFATGDVLSAADVNGYLMQGVLVFADSAERDAEIISPEEGQFAYLKDTNVTTYYTGSSWANLDTTGMTNPMTTTGDTIYSSSGSTPARLGIGTAGQILQVNAGATAPEWAAPAGGGKVLQVVQAITQTITTISSGSPVDSAITATITPSSATSKVLVLVSGQTSLTRSTGGSRQTRFASNICRNGTPVFDDSSGQTFGIQYTAVTTGSVEHFNRVALTYLDSPATTSATTYKVQYIGDVGWTLTAQQGSAKSSIILLEIGA